MSEKINDNNRQVYYKCAACGFLHDGKDGAPASCIKCDNDKFYKITKGDK